jgi:hypothetical protein
MLPILSLYTQQDAFTQSKDNVGIIDWNYLWSTLLR